MSSYRIATVALFTTILVAGVLPAACSSSDDAENDTGGLAGSAGQAGTGGTAGASSGGQAGAAAGGKGGTGGAAGASSGGQAGAGGDAGSAGQAGAGGAAGASSGGQAGAAGANSFWADAYDPNGYPPVPSGKHNQGQNCLSCHGPGFHPFVFAGTVFDNNNVDGQPHVQIGVRVGDHLYTSYTGDNGNFWFEGTDDIDWTQAEVRVRNANGELAMNGKAKAACSSCHGTVNSPIHAP